MGLKFNANKGAKVVFQQVIPQAFTRCGKLKYLLQMSGLNRGNLVNIIDGNVLLRAVPTGVCTCSDFVFYVYNCLLDVVSTAEFIFVVFEEILTFS